MSAAGTADNIIYIKPKQDTFRYRRQTVALLFLPATREWRWTITVTNHTQLGGRSGSMSDAIAAAKRFVDLVVDR